jgi:poly-gamma-glutamate synthesis protein (capsule biosynthesis protein)
MGTGTITNRDAGKVTVLIMTGVTAMARNSGVAIERSGDWGFLARQVGPELAAADITIISNEIPFMPDCVADNSLNNLLLCSKPEYWENLDLSGVDAIGLTGNHMNDFGYDNFRWTLDYYKEKKTPYYAGGADEKSARQPLVLEQNGNRLGFLGANSWGPEAYWNGKGEEVSAWAGEANPGAARFDLARMQADIAALKPQVNLVFAEVQHTEFNEAGDYQTEPIPQQEADFRAMIDAGADVVTGVMAHAPQAVETRNGKLILYGLGNLYFDQTWSWPTQTGLVARHTLYKGKLINTELLVTVIEKNFQLRWATPAERIQVLKSVFDVSRWQ